MELDNGDKKRNIKRLIKVIYSYKIISNLTNRASF